jgi:DNA replication protein DnaD
MQERIKISKGRKKNLIKIPVAFLDEYLKKVNGDYLKIYLYGLKICTENISLTDEEIAKNLGILKNDVKNAWKYWEDEGLVNISEDGTIEFENPEEINFLKNKNMEQIPQTPQISFVDIFSVVKKDKKFKKSIQIVESIYSELLTQNDVLMLYDVTEVQKIPLELFITTLSYCIKNNKKNFKYIVKTVSENYKKGLITVEALESHYHMANESKEYIGQVKRELKIMGRDLIDKEKEFVEKWNLANKSMDEIKQAYEKTIMNTGKLSFPYMDKILSSQTGNKPAMKSSIKAGCLNNFTQDLPDFNKITDALIKKQKGESI